LKERKRERRRKTDEPVEIFEQIDSPNPLENETLLILVGSFLSSRNDAYLGRPIHESEGL